MILAALIASVVPCATLRVAGNALREELQAPATGTWTDATTSATWEQGWWRGGATVRLLERYDLLDGSLGLMAGLRRGTLDLELGLDRGFTRRFAADATGRADLRWIFQPRWTLGAGLRAQGFRSQASMVPEALLETYAGPFRFEARANLPVSDGTTLDPGGRLTAEWWWSDAGATGLSAGRSSESEIPEQGGGLLVTRVTTWGWTIREDLFAGTICRGAVTWTRQGALHDRWGFGLGVEHAFQL